MNSEKSLTSRSSECNIFKISPSFLKENKWRKSYCKIRPEYHLYRIQSQFGTFAITKEQKRSIFLTLEIMFRIFAEVFPDGGAILRTKNLGKVYKYNSKLIQYIEIDLYRP